MSLLNELRTLYAAGRANRVFDLSNRLKKIIDESKLKDLANNGKDSTILYQENGIDNNECMILKDAVKLFNKESKELKLDFSKEQFDNSRYTCIISSRWNNKFPWF